MPGVCVRSVRYDLVLLDDDSKECEAKTQSSFTPLLIEKESGVDPQAFVMGNNHAEKIGGGGGGQPIFSNS